MGRLLFALPVLLLVLSIPAWAQAPPATSAPPGCTETFLPGFKEYSDPKVKETWDAYSAKTKGVCQTRDFAGCTYTVTIGDPMQPGPYLLCWWGTKAVGAAVGTSGKSVTLELGDTYDFKAGQVIPKSVGTPRATRFGYFDPGGLSPGVLGDPKLELKAVAYMGAGGLPSVSSCPPGGDPTYQIHSYAAKGAKGLAVGDTFCVWVPDLGKAAALQVTQFGSVTFQWAEAGAASPQEAAVSLTAHPLSACFQSAVNAFNAAVKSGKGLDAAGAEAQALVEKVCPDLDFTGLELSSQAEKCKADFEACTAGAKDSATCKRALLLCIATTPEAKAYKLQTLEMNLKVDRAGLLKRDSTEVATADAAGRDIGVLKVKSEGGKLKEASWESKPIAVDFTGADPDVGKGEVKVNLGLKDLPETAQLKLNAKRDDEVKKALDAEVAKKSLKVLGVAFSVDVQTDMPVKDATFQIKSNKAWADKQGISKVKVIRQSVGATEVLDTKFKGYEGDLAVFETTSPGLSIFSLAAVEPAPAAPPPAKSPGFEALLGLAGLGAALLLVRRQLF